MHVIKLLTPDRTNYRDGSRKEGSVWTPGVWRQARGAGEYNDSGWFHGYTTLSLALFIYSQHNIEDGFHAWIAETDGPIEWKLFKIGAQRMRIVREVSVVMPTKLQCLRFAILSARTVLPRGVIPAWEKWADDVLAAGIIDPWVKRGAARAAKIAWAESRAAESVAWAAAAVEWAEEGAGAWTAAVVAEVARVAKIVGVRQINFEALAEQAMKNKPPPPKDKK